MSRHGPSSSWIACIADRLWWQEFRYARSGRIGWREAARSATHAREAAMALQQRQTR